MAGRPSLTPMQVPSPAAHQDDNALTALPAKKSLVVFHHQQFDRHLQQLRGQHQ